jgi:hypothetical protein
MAFLRGLSELGVQLNPPHLGDWPFRIGQYMINFSGIELISYQYLTILEANRADFNKNLRHLLSARINRIMRLVDASAKITDLDKAEIKALWEEARELSRWRNRIAHNAILPTWKAGSNSQSDPPDLIGIPDMRQIEASDESNSISLDGLVMLVDASYDLGNRLHVAAAKLPKRG